MEMMDQEHHEEEEAQQRVFLIEYPHGRCFVDDQTCLNYSCIQSIWNRKENKEFSFENTECNQSLKK